MARLTENENAMKVSTLNRVFLIAALWDLAGTPRTRVANCECFECLGDECGSDCTSRRADEAWAERTRKVHEEIVSLAKPIGGLVEVFSGLLYTARSLAKEDTREGRRAARIMRKSYARAS